MEKFIHNILSKVKSGDMSINDGVNTLQGHFHDFFDWSDNVEEREVDYLFQEYNFWFTHFKKD